MSDTGVQVRSNLLNLLRTLLAGGVAAALLSACSGISDYSTAFSDDLPTRASVPEVPLIRQADYFCGPASLAMVLSWSGPDVTQQEIAAQSFSPSAKGTFRADLIGAARRRGQLVVPVADFSDLLTEVAAGHPVIVFQNLSLGVAPRWHYAVVVGFDRSKQELTLHSGELEIMQMPFEAFERTWMRGDRWAITVLPPDHLPAAAPEDAVLLAAAALEETGMVREAEAAYAAGMQRWSDAWIWPFGLGNARYAQGDLSGAEQAFRIAAGIAPDVPEIDANLAQVRSELGR